MTDGTETETWVEEFLTRLLELADLDVYIEEISIDDEEWLPCRQSVGYWWYDWSHFTVGHHSLQARIPSAGTRELKSKPRQFTVLG